MVPYIDLGYRWEQGLGLEAPRRLLATRRHLHCSVHVDFWSLLRRVLLLPPANMVPTMLVRCQQLDKDNVVRRNEYHDNEDHHTKDGNNPLKHDDIPTKDDDNDTQSRQRPRTRTFPKYDDKHSGRQRLSSSSSAIPLFENVQLDIAWGPGSRSLRMTMQLKDQNPGA
ncbi:hypothetical protein BDZ89DRAFT_1039600 [Hymenopellis radicata]|nr:hypothetical protein BDZ89DRAFT_1039600 [Hymenopellis radicata]